MSGLSAGGTDGDWTEQCLRQCRAEAVCSLRALLQENSSDPLPIFTNGRSPGGFLSADVDKMETASFANVNVYQLRAVDG